MESINLGLQNTLDSFDGIDPTLVKFNGAMECFASYAPEFGQVFGDDSCGHTPLLERVLMKMMAWKI
ncbi:MAG: hypothetical protein ABFS56_27075 [Pseudomonadota bacterium]